MKTQAINETDLVSTAEHRAACHSTPQHTVCNSQQIIMLLRLNLRRHDSEDELIRLYELLCASYAGFCVALIWYLANSAAGFVATKFSTGASAAFSVKVEPTICFTTPLCKSIQGRNFIWMQYAGLPNADGPIRGAAEADERTRKVVTSMTTMICFQLVITIIYDMPVLSILYFKLKLNFCH